MSVHNAKVYLVGTGPGDAELLTVKAFRLIQQAEVVVYDRLVSDAIMALVPAGAMRIFAGKSCKQHAMTQAEINDTLVRLAKSGRTVLRLKGGDPFIFGRGGEEALELAAQGVRFEVIPGVTSAAGCAAYAGIPLTHRGLATGFRILTGHLQDGNLPEHDWAGLADPETTLILYMGLGTLAHIAGRLMEHGMPADLPAALVERGTCPEQRTALGTLANIAELAEAQAFKPPSLVIIGKVAALAKPLQWWQPDVVEAEAPGYFSISS